jgi:hypothetical protein
MRGEYSNSYAYVDAYFADTDRYTGYVQLVSRSEHAYGVD